ncbi:MAG TPA: hypothetical protein VKE40_27205 [Gemmataceae bacterium]|nr:hypothetical protein [Gemmataceae bacterium]
MQGPESATIEVHEVPAQIRGLAVGAFAMSFFSLLVFWLIPWGFLLGLASIILGALSIALGVRTVNRGLYLPLGAVLVAGTSMTMALLTTKLSHWIFVEF